MEFRSNNPFNGKEVGVWKALNQEQLIAKLEHSHDAFKRWRHVSLNERSQLMLKAGKLLNENVEEYARMITLEMGKPITESRAEIKKCAWVCEYYSENSARFLADEVIETDANKSLVQHHPIGTVLAIMPWNFPFWQVFRFAAPTLLAGNTALLKHAANVFGCANLIEEVFQKAGFPSGVFQNLIVHHDASERIIAHHSVQAVSLTGSERAGSAVAEISGKHIKRSLLDLGGNNAFIVWVDADIE